jgi:hypothetical protein
MSNVLGVFRESEFSPGREDDDAAILERTRAALAERGITLTLGGIDLLAQTTPTAVLAMCQSRAALEALDRCATMMPVINTPTAIRGCYRHETVRRLGPTAVPFPSTRLISTIHDPDQAPVLAPCWVKRGDVHAMMANDVVFAEKPEDVRAVLADFKARGITRAALQAHVTGVVVKFYGIADGRFFRCYTQAAEVPAPIPLLWQAAQSGARALGLEVFGGDLVVTENGRPVLVDLNDWPSFARCRDEAADAIASYVVDRLATTASPQPQGQHG